MFIENATYTWTKAFAAFYDLTALGLYLSAWRRSDLAHGRGFRLFVHRIAGALLGRGDGSLPWNPLLGFFVPPSAAQMARNRRFGGNQRRHLYDLVGMVAGCLRRKVTFGSNTTVTGSKQFTFGGNLLKIAENTFNTLVPFPLRGSYMNDPAYNRRLPAQDLAYCRDWCFAIYQTEFPAMLGLVD